MTQNLEYDVLIIGGSYSGLSAALALGRASRRVLIIDSGKPCNAQTPHSHNFITQDGTAPHQIAELARQQVAAYQTIGFYNGLAVSAAKTATGFAVTTQAGDTFSARKLVFATGVKDLMPALSGFAECWGISVIHCPFCHGYEVRNQKTGILGNGEYGFEFSKLIRNWTSDLTLFTNGKSTLSEAEQERLAQHNIAVAETEISHLQHQNGHLERVVFTDGSSIALTALYARPTFQQHCPIPEQLGCELTEMGHLKADFMQKTTVEGVYACGDCTTPMRAVFTAVAQGTMAGASVTRELIAEDF